MNPSASRVRKSGSSITYSYIFIVQLRKVTLHGLALSAGRRFHKNPHAPFSTRSNAHPRLTQYSGGGGHMRSVDVYEGELVYLDRRPCSDSPDRGRELLFGLEVRRIALSTRSAGTGDRDSGIVGLLVLVLWRGKIEA